MLLTAVLADVPLWFAFHHLKLMTNKIELLFLIVFITCVVQVPGEFLLHFSLFNNALILTDAYVVILKCASYVNKTYTFLYVNYSAKGNCNLQNAYILTMYAYNISDHRLVTG